MKCPVCPDSTLSMSNREGIEIDYCPQCRGVWLDRGELDKIIERSLAQPPSQAAAPPPTANRGSSYVPPPPRYDDDDDRRYREHGDYHKDYHKRKRRGFLGELFDFD
ncbi:MAG: zf-TFIIB domain-containing protein [Steroidobacteraceae bacterium]